MAETTTGLGQPYIIIPEKSVTQNILSRVGFMSWCYTPEWAMYLQARTIDSIRATYKIYDLFRLYVSVGDTYSNVATFDFYRISDFKSYRTLSDSENMKYAWNYQPKNPYEVYTTGVIQANMATALPPFMDIDPLYEVTKQSSISAKVEDDNIYVKDNGGERINMLIGESEHSILVSRDTSYTVLSLLLQIDNGTYK